MLFLVTKIITGQMHEVLSTEGQTQVSSLELNAKKTLYSATSNMPDK